MLQLSLLVISLCPLDPVYPNESQENLNFDKKIDKTRDIKSSILPESTRRLGDSLDNNGNNNPRCGDVFSMVTDQKKMFYCKPRKTGRYVNIRLLGENKYLTLCEVAVYSESKGNVLVTQQTLHKSQ